MTRSRKFVPQAMAAILLAYLALALWYSVMIPLGEAPDEVPHFTVIRFLAQNARLPTGTDEHEAWQPPLYYALGAAVTFWIEDDAREPFAVRANAHFDPIDPRAPKNLLLHSAAEAWPYRGWVLAWHLVRLLSVALGAITVWAVFRLGYVLFPEHPAIPLAMAALTAFTPQFVFMSAVANNDNAATAFSALTLWQVAALLHEPSCSRLWRRSAVLGLLLGVAVLSKASLVALLPVAGAAIVVSSAKCQRTAESATAGESISAEYGAGRPSWFSGRIWQAAVALVLAFGLAALLAGWYFARNWQLFGDPMGWSFLRQTHALREGPLTLGLVAWMLAGVFRSFWLGWIGIAFDDLIYWLIGLVCLGGIAGNAVWLVRRLRWLGWPTRWTFALLGLHAALTLASLIQWTATVQGTDQGRLIYPILPTVMLVIATGWAWWATGRAQRWVLGTLAAGMLCLAMITPLRYIAPVHAPAPVATEEELAASSPLETTWGDVKLLGYRLDSDQVRAGGELGLDLYWEGLRPTEWELMALIQLVGADDQFLMYLDGSPTAGRDTTDRWIPDVPLASHHILRVPDYGLPGEYRVTISLHPFGREAWLPGHTLGGPLAENRLVLPEVILVSAP